jgi:hypothetical protein
VAGLFQPLADERCLVGVVLEIRDSHASPLRRGALGASCGEALEELLPLLAHRFDVALLDVAEAANLVGKRAISTAPAWFCALRPASSCSTVCSYSRISSRSMRRSSVAPEGSSAVPLRNLKLVRTLKTAVSKRPKRILRGSPVSGSAFAKSGRREVVVRLVAALEHVRDLLSNSPLACSRRPRIRPCSEQLVVVARNRFGELRRAAFSCSILRTRSTRLLYLSA